VAFDSSLVSIYRVILILNQLNLIRTTPNLYLRQKTLSVIFVFYLELLPHDDFFTLSFVSLSASTTLSHPHSVPPTFFKTHNFLTHKRPPNPANMLQQIAKPPAYHHLRHLAMLHHTPRNKMGKKYGLHYAASGHNHLYMPIINKTCKA